MDADFDIKMNTEKHTQQIDCNSNSNDPEKQRERENAGENGRMYALYGLRPTIRKFINKKIYIDFPAILRQTLYLPLNVCYTFCKIFHQGFRVELLGVSDRKVFKSLNYIT